MNKCQFPNGGAAPATPGFNAFAPEWLINYGAADAAPAIPAAESALGSHPCVALSSTQVLPEWINPNLAAKPFASDGDYPLTSCLNPWVHFKTPTPRPAPLPGSYTKSLTDADHFSMIETAQRRFAPTVIDILRISDRHQFGMSDRLRRNPQSISSCKDLRACSVATPQSDRHRHGLNG
jgi:hypothetical protein